MLTNLPQLSITLVTPTSLSRLKETIDALKQQTCVESLEILLISKVDAITEQERLTLASFFWGVTLIELTEITNVGECAYEGLPYAKAPIIVFLEDHVYPIKEWAKYLIAAHEGPWAAIGSNYLNANPNTNNSWAILLLFYGSNVCQKRSEEVEELPVHNCSYKCKLIRPYFNETNSLIIDWENSFHNQLKRDGHSLYFEGKSKLYHRNAKHFKEITKINYAAGRLYSSHRVKRENWSILQKLIYFFGSPLIPFVRFVQIWRNAMKFQNREFLSAMAWLSLFFQLIIDAIGQAFGFLFGKGTASQIITQHELYERKDI